MNEDKIDGIMEAAVTAMEENGEGPLAGWKTVEGGVLAPDGGLLPGWRMENGQLLFPDGVTATVEAAKALAAWNRKMTGRGLPPSNNLLPCGHAPLPLVPNPVFETTKFPKREVLIQNLLHLEDVAIISALTGTGKTWILIDAFLSVVTGRKWLGWLDVLQGQALPIFFEGGGDEIGERIRRVREARGIDAAETKWLFPLCAEGLGITFANFDDWILQTLHALKMLDDTVLLALDPGSRLFASANFDENNNTHGTQFAEKVQKIGQEGHLGIILTWHTGQRPDPKADPITLARGASAITSAFENKFAAVWDNPDPRKKDRKLLFKGWGRQLPAIEWTWEWTFPVFNKLPDNDSAVETVARSKVGRPASVTLDSKKVVSLFADKGRTFTRTQLVTAIVDNGWAGKTIAGEKVTEFIGTILDIDGPTSRPHYKLGPEGLAMWEEDRALDPHGVNHPPPGITDADVVRLAGLYPDAETGEKGLTEKELQKAGKGQLMSRGEVTALLRDAIAAKVLQGDGAAVPKFMLRGRAADARRDLDKAPAKARPAGAEA